jgi:predicted O-methyltransferase YrrM
VADPAVASAGAVPEVVLAHAKRAKGFMPEGEGMALSRAAELAATAGPEPLLEIGSYCGKSTLYLAAGVLTSTRHTTHPPNLLYSLDHHRGSEELQAGWEHHDPDLVDPATGLLETLPHWRASVHAAGIDTLVVGLIGDSPRIAAAWTTPLRLVFVDGGHGEAPAWADYNGWAPKVVLGGLLCIHDVFESPADGGRPPFDIYKRALGSGAFSEIGGASSGSLRVLERVSPGR